MNAEPREASQKIDDVRAEDRIPAVIYGGKREGAMSLSVDRGQTVKALKQLTPSTVVDVDIDGKKVMALITEIQRHPVTDDVLHVDFRQVETGIPVKTKINLVFTGESPVVKNLGGVLVVNRDRVLVSSAPENLVSQIEIDLATISSFDITISIKDLPLPEGVEIIDDLTASVALVQMPKSKEEIAAEEAAEDASDAAQAAAAAPVTGGEKEGEEAKEEGGDAKADAAEEKDAK